MFSLFSRTIRGSHPSTAPGIGFLEWQNQDHQLFYLPEIAVRAFDGGRGWS